MTPADLKRQSFPQVEHRVRDGLAPGSGMHRGQDRRVVRVTRIVIGHSRANTTELALRTVQRLDLLSDHGKARIGVPHKQRRDR